MKKDYFVIDMHSHVADPDTPTRISEMSISNERAQEAFEGLLKWQRDVGYNKGMIELNPSPENYARAMKDWGTDMSVLSMLGFTEELNGIEICPSQYIADILPKYKGTFLGFAGVDPRLPDAAEKIEYFIKEKGFSGAKINPNDWGTFPLDSPQLISIYEKCQELNIPLHIHTGVDPTGYIEYGNPILLDKIAVKYPDLKILLEHYGFPYKYEAFAMCTKHKNVYISLAAHFNKLVHHNKVLAWMELEEMRIHAGIDKILYGSDYPATPNNKEVIDFLKYGNIPLVLRLSGMKNWTDEMRARVLGINAAKVLGLSNEKIKSIENRFTKSEKELKLQTTMDWSQEAIEVLNTIPVFIRKSAVNKIEEYARKNKYYVITPEVMKSARKA